MFSVGLTGGIASGKTTVSDLFANLGVPVVDTDIISRELLDPGELAYRQLRERFGDELLRADATIDRAALRKIVFSDSRQKKWLEAMLHPLIFQRCQHAIAAHAAASYVLVVIPLLFETDFQSLVDRILVVDCPPEQQLRRLMKRDDIDENLARKMLAQQLANEERVARADDVISNVADDSDLAGQVDALHRCYLEIAANR